MATSGSFNTTGYSNRYLTFSWSVTSQNRTDNSTTIAWKVTGAGSASGYYVTRKVKVVIDGQTVYNQGTGSVDLRNGTIVAQGAYTFTHDSHGTRTFSASVTAAIYTWDTNCSGSDTGYLPQIFKLSTISCTDAGLGEEHTLTVTRHSPGYSHTITWTCGESSGTICTRSKATTFTWTPLFWLANMYPTSTRLIIRYTITTHNEAMDTAPVLGSTTASCAIVIPDNDTWQPSIAHTTSDSTTCKAKYGSYVQKHSKLRVEITAYGVFGSYITKWYVGLEGNTYVQNTPSGNTNSVTITTNAIIGSGTIPVKVTVVDSRGLKRSVTQNIEVIPYEYPQITSISATRCDSDGTANTSGRYFDLKFSSVVSSLNNVNQAKFAACYKSITEMTYREIDTSAFDGRYTVTNGHVIVPTDTLTTHDVLFSVYDDFLTVTKSVIAPSAAKVWSMLKKDGEIVGMAVGKVAEHEGVFDIGWKMKASGGGDVVVEIGQTDGWTWRKWDSGIAECWKIHEFSTTIGTAFGSLYCGNATARQTYPFVFAEKPVENVTLQSGSTQAFLYVETGEHGVNGTNSSARYNVFRPGAMTSSQTFYLSFHVIGKWK